jgi:hypothetical protein
MASAGENAFEDALNVLVSVTERGGNLRNDLRKDILKAVSNLRKEIFKLKHEVEDKNKLSLRNIVERSSNHCCIGNETILCVCVVVVVVVIVEFHKLSTL